MIDATNSRPACGTRAIRAARSCRRPCGGSASTRRRRSSRPHAEPRSTATGWRDHRRRGDAGAPAARRRRARAHDARHAERLLRRQRGRQGRLAVDPPGRGARADRPVGLRQDDAAAHAQPAHRADAERPPRGRIRSTATDVDAHRGDRAAPPRLDGLPAAEPVPDVDLRQRRLRAARAGLASAPSKPALEPRVEALGARRPVGRGQGQARPPGAAAVRRPAAAAVHRARAGGRARGAADGRAVLGARPALDGGDRGADRRAAQRARGRDRHPQPAAGAPRRRPRRVHVPRRARRVRARPSRSSTRPQAQRTRDYVGGAFG